MSWMKSINHTKANVSKLGREEFEGPVDALIVSPAVGEPWFIYFKKEQMSRYGAFNDLKNFIKGYKHNSERGAGRSRTTRRTAGIRCAAHQPCTHPDCEHLTDSHSSGVPMP